MKKEENWKEESKFDIKEESKFDFTEYEEVSQESLKESEEILEGIKEEVELEETQMERRNQPSRASKSAIQKEGAFSKYFFRK